MNRYAYLTSGRAIALMQAISQVRVNIHGRELIPDGSLIFVINHFTRIETLLLPYHIFSLTGRPVWSLADATMFGGTLGKMLDAVGAVSTSAPDRDRLIVKSLLSGEAHWIIFPEGYMVKDKAIVEKTRYAISRAGGRRPPHTGAAFLAFRTEFYRQRLRMLVREFPDEAERLRQLFGIDDLAPVLAGRTAIVPVNITYYPLRARENALSRLAGRLFGQVPARFHEELLTEGAMLLEGVDIDIRFGAPIEVGERLSGGPIRRDISSPQRIDFNDHLPSRREMRREADLLTKGYMEAIYGLTTVNHDHLFASLLRAIPFREFAEDDFRRRVFLLIQKMGESGLFRHQSMESGQIALLTDDRYHKCREFLALALETGVLRRKGSLLVKDPAKFSSSFDLHRARLDNPIGVVANEVLPLVRLQRLVRVMAWLPPQVVRYLAGRHLLRQAEREFDADYNAFFRTGESKGREVGRPILIRGSKRELGVVLVHGFLAAPRELKGLAEYLGRQGLWVYVTRLKGHGTSPEDLARCSSSDWRESVDVGVAALELACNRVVVGGFSFGGGLALECAARLGRVAGVFAVCPPMRLQDISSRFAPTVLAWNRLMDFLNYRTRKKEYVEIFPEHPEINYHRLPVAALVEMGAFMKELEPKLPAISAPVLIAQAQGDPVVDPAGSKLLYDRLGSGQKSYRLFERHNHGILQGEGADKVYAVIGEFIEKLRGAARN